MVRFEEKEHVYKSDNNINWTSVTTFIGLFKEKFDALSAAKKTIKNKNSKWYKMTVEDVLKAWEEENKKSLELGNWYHKKKEEELISKEKIERDGVSLNIIKPVVRNGIKYSINQELKEGIYPEHIIYMESIGLCGQSDLVEIVNNKINVYDYKTNKEIKIKSFVNWEGKSQKMKPPLSHLDDCNFNHYALQLSFYAFMIKKHNPKLTVNKLQLHHIKFNDSEEVVNYDLPYLKNEIENLVIFAKNNGYKTF